MRRRSDLGMVYSGALYIFGDITVYSLLYSNDCSRLYIKHCNAVIGSRHNIKLYSGALNLFGALYRIGGDITVYTIQSAQHQSSNITVYRCPLFPYRRQHHGVQTCPKVGDITVYSRV